ncbi:unnamed protein product [Adineta ricciae]|uniref:G-protein coupled receptors family 1 profile domain-containing protein n=1 Tax=Adineta ricciae TaxID=249248 RepID=A0A815AP22_ADIRI|nr:unnamed protein product [Adineta ricciae]CAF1502465.1 unnamed protein product [Adineta ricciae]
MLFNETSSKSTEELNFFGRILMTIIFACICILGVIGNLIVLILSIQKQTYRFVTNCYIINLAITDLLFLMISVPLTTYLGLKETWILAPFISCRVHIYFAHILLQATCYTLATMSIDRYLYVISSHPRPKWRTPLNAFIICILIWIVSIVLAFPYTSLLYSSSISSENEKNFTHDCPISSSHLSIVSCFFPFSAYYILPLLIIALCYTKLCIYMKQMSKSLTKYRNSLVNCGSHLIRKRRRVTRTLFSLICAFAVCWFPIHLLEFLNCGQMLSTYYDQHSQLLDVIRIIAHALSYFNSCLNPVLYALYNRESFT